VARRAADWIPVKTCDDISEATGDENPVDSQPTLLEVGLRVIQ